MIPKPPKGPNNWRPVSAKPPKKKSEEELRRRARLLAFIQEIDEVSARHGLEIDSSAEIHETATSRLMGCLYERDNDEDGKRVERWDVVGI